MLLGVKSRKISSFAAGRYWNPGPFTIPKLTSLCRYKKTGGRRMKNEPASRRTDCSTPAADG
jgi:hypothetical protein